MKRKESNERRGIIIPLIAMGVVARSGLWRLRWISVGSRLPSRRVKRRRMLRPLRAREAWMGRKTFPVRRRRRLMRRRPMSFWERRLRFGSGG